MKASNGQIKKENPAQSLHQKVNTLKEIAKAE